jgi:hypothetical protein
MPKVRLILEEDEGVTTQQIYDLPEDLASLDEIDEAIEQFRLQALPVLEKQLLHKVQQTAVQQEKKTGACGTTGRKYCPYRPATEPSCWSECALKSLAALRCPGALKPAPSLFALCAVFCSTASPLPMR